MANELILVVEDNDKNRKLVRDVLTFKGYEIIEAGIDGIEALGLRAEPATRGIPVMAMTASVMTEDRQRIGRRI